MSTTTETRPSRTGAIENLAVRTLAGDVRDALLHRLKHEQDKRAWTDRSEDEQRATINQITQVAEALVRGVVRLIGSEALPALGGTLASVTVKDGIKAVLELNRNDENRHALYDAEGKQVMVVLADPTQFFGAREEWSLKKDQPDLPLDADDDDQAVTYWVLGTGTEGNPPPRFDSVVDALVESGAEFLDPREMGDSTSSMTRFGVLTQTVKDGESITGFRTFATLGEAVSFCAAEMKRQQDEAVANLMAMGETASVS